MRVMRSLTARMRREEDGHVWRGVTALLGAAGAIVLTLGVTGANDTLAWIGGVVVALAFLNSGFMEHSKMDYPLYRRVDELEKSR